MNSIEPRQVVQFICGRLPSQVCSLVLVPRHEAGKNTSDIQLSIVQKHTWISSQTRYDLVTLEKPLGYELNEIPKSCYILEYHKKKTK